MKVKLAVLLLVVFYSIAHTEFAFGQAGTTTLDGTVSDPSGNAVAGATVQAVNTATNVAYPAKTNNSGLYNLPGLPPGNYKISVDEPGFSSQIKPDVELHVADVVSTNFVLQLGAVSQTVTVTGGAPLVNTSSSSLGGLVDARQIANLPLNGRNYINLTLMQPGVTPDVSEIKTGVFAGSWFSSNGAPIRRRAFWVREEAFNFGRSSSIF